MKKKTAPPPPPPLPLHRSTTIFVAANEVSTSSFTSSASARSSAVFASASSNAATHGFTTCASIADSTSSSSSSLAAGQCAKNDAVVVVDADDADADARKRRGSAGAGGGFLNSLMFKILILAWYVVQNTVFIMLVSFTRTRSVSEVYYPEVAALVIELIKLPICVLMLLIEARGNPFIVARIMRTQMFDTPIDSLKLGFPAFLYCVQNVLLYYAAGHLSATAFMIAQQLKLFFAAVFSVLVLRRRLSVVHWLALIALFVGVSVVQVTTSGSATRRQTSAGGIEQVPVIGFVLTVIGCLTSGFSGVYLELIYKKGRETSIWMRNIQLSMFMVPITLCFVLVKDYTKILETSVFYGFDWIVWALALWMSLGSLTVSVCLKYADNIIKDMATSLAIILATIVSVMLLHFAPSWLFCVGAAMVIGAIFLYSYANRINNWIAANSAEKRQTRIGRSFAISQRNRNKIFSTTTTNVDESATTKKSGVSQPKQQQFDQPVFARLAYSSSSNTTTSASIDDDRARGADDDETAAAAALVIDQTKPSSNAQNFLQHQTQKIDDGGAAERRRASLSASSTVSSSSSSSSSFPEPGHCHRSSSGTSSTSLNSSTASSAAPC